MLSVKNWQKSRSKGVLVQWLVGIAIEGVAFAIPVGASTEHPLTEQQIRRLLNGLTDLPPRATYEDAIECERFGILSCAQCIQHGDTSALGMQSSGTVLKTITKSCNWNIIYRRLNEMYDAMQEPCPRMKFDAMLAKAMNMSPWKIGNALTPNGRGNLVADILIALLTPAVEAAEEAGRRSECVENMQRLALAVLLYQLEHGQLPDENWVTQILDKKYLGEDAERLFSCPSNPAPAGETTYALVQYGDALPDDPDTILLVELKVAVPFDQAVVSADDVYACNGTGSVHRGGMNVAYSSAAVRFLSETTKGQELAQLLGRETESDEE